MKFIYTPGTVLTGKLSYIDEQKNIFFDPDIHDPTVLVSTASLVVAGSLQIVFSIKDG